MEEGMSRRAPPGGRPFAAWNIDRVIAVYGGIEPLIAEHHAFGFDELSYGQVSNWRLRHRCPSDTLAELFVVLLAREPQLDLTQFLHGKQ